MKVIKIGAVWCAGCLIMKPRWAKIEEELPWLKTEFFDYDLDREKVKALNVDKILPVCIFIDDNGNELARLNGEQSKKVLLSMIEKYKDC
ncbi:MAG: thioredoxin family protein [Erysipelotrichaceae bacterium]|jgi:thiol-disulfide isomerase/thioredoxin|nr:thioredoxin family protein [Erysipelotrichaceae bacterium]MDD3924417.1 thioredoxin family protein [Erysipelotrichaceae bacterium]MDD4642285.1 thioredoxin family protein [Erysipelotrichaceae bacterium]